MHLCIDADVMTIEKSIWVTIKLYDSDHNYHLPLSPNIDNMFAEDGIWLGGLLAKPTSLFTKWRLFIGTYCNDR